MVIKEGFVYAFSKYRPSNKYHDGKMRYYQRGYGWQDEIKTYDWKSARSIKGHLTEKDIMVSKYRQELILIQKLPL